MNPNRLDALKSRGPTQESQAPKLLRYGENEALRFLEEFKQYIARKNREKSSSDPELSDKDVVPYLDPIVKRFIFRSVLRKPEGECEPNDFYQALEDICAVPAWERQALVLQIIGEEKMDMSNHSVVSRVNDMSARLLHKLDGFKVFDTMEDPSVWPEAWMAILDNVEPPAVRSDLTQRYSSEPPKNYLSLFEVILERSKHYARFPATFLKHEPAKPADVKATTPKPSFKQQVKTKPFQNGSAKRSRDSDSSHWKLGSKHEDRSFSPRPDVRDVRKGSHFTKKQRSSDGNVRSVQTVTTNN